jgi:phage FluMu protein Com
MDIRTYRCADCGKVVTYDARALDKLEIKRAKLVDVDGTNVEVGPSDEEDETQTDGTATEFLDFEMSEWDYGRMLCKDCIKKEQERLYKQSLKT